MLKKLQNPNKGRRE